VSTMSGFSLAALKNTLDEVRVSVYAKNETEKKVRNIWTCGEAFITWACITLGLRGSIVKELGCFVNTDDGHCRRNTRIVRGLSTAESRWSTINVIILPFAVISFKLSMISYGLP
jgi:hypothetical protein